MTGSPRVQHHRGRLGSSGTKEIGAAALSADIRTRAYHRQHPSTTTRLHLIFAAKLCNEWGPPLFPDADWQRCVVHFYRNVFSHVPSRKVRKVAAILKAIHAQESRSAAQAKAEDVIGKLKAMKLAAAAELITNGIGETLTYYSLPSQHWLKIRTNNPMERLLREARRRTKVVGAFLDGHSALMLVAAQLRHVSATQWGLRKYMNIRLIEEMNREAVYSAA